MRRTEAYSMGKPILCSAGGTESAVTPIGIGGFAALTALSESTDPLKASLPFDKNRNGFVMGEGAGVVVLEELGACIEEKRTYLCRSSRIWMYI